jgi:hypothetical protein
VSVPGVAAPTDPALAPDAAIDPELEALPEPRRPWRRTTLLTMALTAVAALWVAWDLGPLARYAAASGPPLELGALTHVQLAPGVANTWVHAVGALAAQGVEYRRPLDPDRFRLVQAEQTPRVWVELRIPKDIEPERYVAPNSFVGRLVPLDHAGLRHAAIGQAVGAALGHPPGNDAWVLVDGETPASTRWAAALVLLFISFAAFNLWGIARLLGPARIMDESGR